MSDNASKVEIKKRKKFLLTCLDYIDDIDARYARESRLISSLDKRTDLAQDQKEEKLQREVKKLIQLKRNFNSLSGELNEPWTFLRYQNNLESDLANLKKSIEMLEGQKWHAVTKEILASLERKYNLLDKVFDAIYLDTDVVRDWQISMLSERVKGLENENKSLEIAIRQKETPVIVQVPATSVRRSRASAAQEDYGDEHYKNV